jgi:hypothetical protein
MMTSDLLTNPRLWLCHCPTCLKVENVAKAGDDVNLKMGAVTVEGFDAGKWNAAFLDTGYPNLQRNRDGKMVPKPADIANIIGPNDV